MSYFFYLILVSTISIAIGFLFTTFEGGDKSNGDGPDDRFPLYWFQHSTTICHIDWEFKQWEAFFNLF